MEANATKDVSGLLVASALVDTAVRFEPGLADWRDFVQDRETFEQKGLGANSEASTAYPGSFSTEVRAAWSWNAEAQG